MNYVHVHLMLNHFPLAGVAFGLALLQWGRHRRSVELSKTALGVLTMTALMSVLVFWSGGQAEDAVRLMPDWPHALIERHEEAAETAVWAVGLLGALAAWALKDSVGRPEPRGGAVQAVALLGMVCLGLMTWTAYRGGQIRHAEIQPDQKEWR